MDADGYVIPAYAGMTEKGGNDGKAVGSRFRGNDVAPGDEGDGALRPVYGAIAPNGFPPTRE